MMMRILITFLAIDMKGRFISSRDAAKESFRRYCCMHCRCQLTIRYGHGLSQPWFAHDQKNHPVGLLRKCPYADVDGKSLPGMHHYENW